MIDSFIAIIAITEVADLELDQLFGRLKFLLSVKTQRPASVVYFAVVDRARLLSVLALFSAVLPG